MQSASAASSVTAPTPPRPVIWKMMLLVWCCLYPYINLLFWLLGPHIGHLPQLVRTLVLSLCMVPLMVLTLGTLQVRLRGWLYR